MLDERATVGARPSLDDEADATTVAHACHRTTIRAPTCVSKPWRARGAGTRSPSTTAADWRRIAARVPERSTKWASLRSVGRSPACRSALPPPAFAQRGRPCATVSSGRRSRCPPARTTSASRQSHGSQTTRRTPINPVAGRAERRLSASPEVAALLLATQEFVANGLGRPSDRRRWTAVSQGRRGRCGRVGQRGCWRSRGAASEARSGSIEMAVSSRSGSELLLIMCASAASDTCTLRRLAPGQASEDQQA